MHKITVGFVILIGLLPICYFASVEMGFALATDDPPAEIIPEEEFDRYVENIAFGVGEKLSFDLNYGFINAGFATMEVARLIEFNGRPSYQLITKAESNRFFSTVFKVDDKVESIMDAIGLFSWRFEKILNEGSYHAHRTYEFDQRDHSVVYENDTITVPPFVQDALSVLYYVRTLDLQVGKSYYVDNFTDGKLYPLEIKVHGKEQVEVEAGTFDCIVVEPLMKSVGVFKHQGTIKVYLTDDRLKLPVLMKSKVVVGSIVAELTDYELGDIEVF